MANDNDESAWFAPKRFGYGSGLPISWQGWAVTVAYVLIVAASVRLIARVEVQIAVVVMATALLLVICARTTRGGWRWRWGNRD